MEDINNQYSEKGEPGQMVSRECGEHQGLPLAIGGHAAQYMQHKGLCGLVRIGGKHAEEDLSSHECIGSATSLSLVNVQEGDRGGGFLISIETASNGKN